MEASYEIFDHTADIGFRIRAVSLPELIAPAAEALYAVIGRLVPVGDSCVFEFHQDGADPAELLRDYLDELLFLFDTQHRCVVTPEVGRFDQTILHVRGFLRPVDSDHTTYHREVKAITYHQLGIREVPGGVEATIIVDI